MKPFTRVLLSALLLITCHATYAKLGVGIKAGPNLSTIKFDDPDASYDSRTGFHAGVFLRARFNQVAVQPEVLIFTQKGESDNSLESR